MSSFPRVWVETKARKHLRAVFTGGDEEGEGVGGEKGGGGARGALRLMLTMGLGMMWTGFGLDSALFLERAEGGGGTTISERRTMSM